MFYNYAKYINIIYNYIIEYNVIMLLILNNVLIG